jgi:hypothetical protein
MSTDASSLNGCAVLAISIGHSFIDEVARGAEDLGARVTRLGPDLDVRSRENVAAGVDAAINAHGAPDLVLLSVVPEQAMRVETIDALSEADWRAIAMEALRTTTRLLQALGPHLKPKGGAIVFVAPSLSLVGTPGMIALSTLLEGQRGLMKSVARQSRALRRGIACRQARRRERRPWARARSED